MTGVGPERWQSGRLHLTRNQESLHGDREFESPPFLQAAKIQAAKIDVGQPIARRRCAASGASRPAQLSPREMCR